MLFSGALLIVILIREIHRGDELLRKSHAAEVALMHARNAAEQANNVKSRFLVAANHDMRQPLQSLSLYTAALEGSDRRSERETICEEMSGAIQAMGTMLDVLLDIENLEDGHVGVEVTEFPVGDLLSYVEREFKLAAREKGLDLRVLSSSLAVRSDRVLLERIVQNLVSNAVSYTLQGQGGRRLSPDRGQRQNRGLGRGLRNRGERAADYLRGLLPDRQPGQRSAQGPWIGVGNRAADRQALGS